MDSKGTNIGLGFVQQYVSHLLPALERIQGERTKQSKSIRYEVDMALALSAKGFTWSNALRSNLEKQKDLEIKKAAHKSQVHSSAMKENMSSLLLPHSTGNRNAHNKCCKYCSAPRIANGNLGEVVCDKICLKNGKKHLSKIIHDEKNKRWRPKLLAKRVKMSREMKQKKSVQAQVQSRIETLRKLTPGGNSMETDVLFQELENYITCLQIQVNVLHHLTQESATP